MPSIRFSAALASALALASPATAAAQGFGLDLTREGPDLQPSLAIVVIALPDAPEPPEAVPASLAKWASDTGLFSRVLTADEARERLAAKGAQPSDCAEAACLVDLCHALEVDRVIVARFGPDSLRVIGYDWGSNALADASVAQEALGAERAVEVAVKPVLRKLAVPLGELAVTTNVESAEIRWGARLVGKGTSFQGAVPAGTQPVTITAEGWEPFEEEVTVPSAGQATLAAELDEKLAPVVVAQVEEEFEPAPPPPPPGKPIWLRPGAWTAAGGVAVLTVGLALGGSASAVSGRMRDADRDGALDVTRAEALGAQRSAAWANVLGVAGAAAIGAGAAWLFLDLRAPAGKPRVAVAATGMGVSVHGAF